MITLRTWALAGLLLSCATAPAPVLSKDIDFKAELARQGEWLVIAPYGRVWHPNPAIAGDNFYLRTASALYAFGEPTAR